MSPISLAHARTDRLYCLPNSAKRRKEQRSYSSWTVKGKKSPKTAENEIDAWSRKLDVQMRWVFPVTTTKSIKTSLKTVLERKKYEMKVDTGCYCHRV
jgi:Txe/YoeB family toxin of Txe-Axe toxin-antitoxin module